MVFLLLNLLINYILINLTIKIPSKRDLIFFLILRLFFQIRAIMLIIVKFKKSLNEINVIRLYYQKSQKLNKTKVKFL